MRDVEGSLNARRTYDDDNGRRHLGPSGPAELDRDGFSSGAWTSWLESFVRRGQRVLDGGWQSVSMDSRSMLSDLLDDKPRVDFLVQHYPDPFAKSIQDDLENLRTSLVDRRYDLDAKALAYRPLGDELAAQVSDSE